MRTSRKLTHALLAIFSLIMLAAAALAADPGAAYPASSDVSDQKAGSLLVYNYYTSGATSGNSQNTRINLTNTSSASSALVHLFFVADTCQVADSYICLTPNQTASFLASDVDPGVSGYIVAVAVDSDGCPTVFNWLIGDEYIKTSAGHAANLGAEAFAGLSRNTEACSTTATLAFSGEAVAEGQAATYHRGILGSILNANPNAAASASAFNGGRNLHKLTFVPTTSYVIPVFPPSC